MNFAPTYQDYLQFGQFGGGDGSGSTPGTEQWFNSLTPEQQFQLIGGNLPVHQGDSRYQGLADATHSTSGSDIFVYGPQNTHFNGEFVDPNHVSQQGGVTISPWDNHSPAAQHNTNLFPQFLELAAALVGGGMGANAAFGFNGAGLAGGAGSAGTGAFDIGGSTGFGGSTALSGAGGAGDAVTTGLLSNIPEPTINSMNLSGLDGTMSGLGEGSSLSGWNGDLGPNGGLDPETANGAGGMGVAQNGIGPGSLADRITGAINNPSSLFSSNGLLSGLSSLAPTSLGGLLRVVGLGTSLSGLFGSHGGNTGGGGGGDGGGGDGGAGKGGGGQGLNINTQRSPYTPNPITQQQLQNFHYAQPRGR